MEESQITSESTDAHDRLKEDTNFNSEENAVNEEEAACEASAEKNSSCNVPEELSRDRSEALSKVQGSQLTNEGATTVAVENSILPKGTNGPVLHSSNKTSILNTDNVSLAINQPVVPQTYTLLYGLNTSGPNPNQPVLFLIPDSAQATIETPSLLKPSTSSVGYETSSDNSFRPPSTSVGAIGECNGKELPGANNSITANEANVSTEGDSVTKVTDNAENNCVAKVQKKRKRKMDGSKITRCYSEDAYNNDVNLSKKSKLINLDIMENSDEEQAMALHKYEMMKMKCESSLDDTEDQLPKEEGYGHYMYSPIRDYSEEASPVHMDSFFSSDVQSCESQSPPTYTGDQEPSFYPCTKCNVNFREKKHLHRHMMCHLDGNNHFRHLNVPRPYACKECGRSFRDRNSLLKHMLIHQERRQKLMEEIRELKELPDEGRAARLQCPQCVFGTNCPKTFVQHAKSHEKDKQYFCCDECNFMAVSENELQLHRSIAHRAAASPLTSDLPQRKQHKKTLKNSYFLSSKKPSSFICKMCPYTAPSRYILKKHMEYVHPASTVDQFNGPVVIKQERISDSELEPETKEFPFPKNSDLKHDVKSGYGSVGPSNNITKMYKKNKVQKARKSAGQYIGGNGPSISPNKSLLFTSNDQKHRYIQVKQKPSRANHAYGYNEKWESYKPLKSDEYIYPLNLKKEEDDGSYQFSESPDLQEECLIMDPHNRHPGRLVGFKDRVAVKRVRRADLEQPVTEEDMDSYPDFLQKVTYVVLKQLDSADKKDEYDAWENGELGTYSTDSPDMYKSPTKKAVFPIYKDKTKDEDSGLCYDNNDGFYFEYYEDGEGDGYMRDMSDMDLENAESGMPGHGSIFHWSDLSLEKKECPYCPALFETGVGLSNHVRGHLHRAGLTYEARHVVSPEQIQTNDKMQHFKRTGTPVKRVRKAIEKSESPSEHSCALCGGWFDTKIGLSNHVRGHLKRLGKNKWDAQKSPICVLNEMLQSEEKYEQLLKILNNRRPAHRSAHRHFSAHRPKNLTSETNAEAAPEDHSNGLHIDSAPEPMFPDELGLSEYDGGSGQEDKDKAPPVTDFVKVKKSKEDKNLDSSQKVTQTARKRLTQKCLHPLNEDCSLMCSSQKNIDLALNSSGVSAKVKTCANCNMTFTSGISLSNHMRAYARRKSAGLLTGTVLDCKQKHKPRSRSGTKKKILPLPHNKAEDIYVLRCRFCGLVFRGPLTVQEDWIKHLQRHIVNAKLPRTGAGMVEVEPLLKKTPSVTETTLPLVAEAAT